MDQRGRAGGQMKWTRVFGGDIREVLLNRFHLPDDLARVVGQPERLFGRHDAAPGTCK